MVVKWTPENDQLLLLKILETSKVNADPKAISLAWPGNEESRPTPRAITERLVKIRSICKASSGTHFSVASAQTKSPNRNNARGTKTSNGNGNASAFSTPRGRKTAGAAAGSGETSSGKRKRSGVLVKMESESEDEGHWSAGSESESEDTPSKKVKTRKPVREVGQGGAGKAAAKAENAFGTAGADAGFGMMAPTQQLAAYKCDGGWDE